MSNLATRVLVAVVGIPVILLVTMAGGFYFYGFVLAVALLGIHEFFRLARATGAEPQTSTGMVFGALVVTVFLYDKVRFALLGGLLERGVHVPFPTMSQAFLILYVCFVPLTLMIELFRNKPGPLRNVSVTLFGVSYVGLFLGSLVGIRELFIPSEFPVAAFFNVYGISVPDDIAATLHRWGGHTVIALFVTIWICDSAAYFAGRAFGRHKLFERVSPNKTWEGWVAGLVFAIGTFVAAREVGLPYLSFSAALICGAIVGVVGQLGDLVESLLKRDAGVKDSSSLIPGHGGVLDRFDSVMMVSPLVFLYLDFVVL